MQRFKKHCQESIVSLPPLNVIIELQRYKNYFENYFCLISLIFHDISTFFLLFFFSRLSHRDTMSKLILVETYY